MAERVKRRVAAARLAVAFVAAGTIAGAGAWASAGPPPTPRKAGGTGPGRTVKFQFTSANIKNGSLLFQDFKAGEVVSADAFLKYKKAETAYKQKSWTDITLIRGDVRDQKARLDGIQGELGNYVKVGDAVMGDGSVFTATKVLSGSGQDPVPFLIVPNLIAVDIMPAEEQIRITNIGGGDLNFSECAGGQVGGGTLKPSGSTNCPTNAQSETMQLIGGSEVVTLNFTKLPAVQGQAGPLQYTAQVLVGM